MDLEGSCHCGAVKFTCKSHAPYPYMKCYCSICRKQDGSGGYGINIMAQHDTLKIEGKEHIKEYRANKNKGKPNTPAEPSENRRYFCDTCGSCLWCYDPAYKDWIYPFAGIIDTPLPTPSKYVHILLNSKAPWVEFDKAAAEKRGDEFFDEYPDKGIEQMHKQNSWWIE